MKDSYGMSRLQWFDRSYVSPFPQEVTFFKNLMMNLTEEIIDINSI